MDEYVDYYKENGFKLSRVQTKKYDDVFTKPFVDGRLDYVVAEHSYQVRLKADVQVIKGTRASSKGVETIQIIFNANFANSTGETKSLDPSEDLSGLIKTRASNQVKTELIFVNAQCFSNCNIQEIATQVDSPYFTYIAPSSLAETFTNSSSTPLAELITGIRLGTSYVQIQKRMKAAQKLNTKENAPLTSIDENAYELPHRNIRLRTEHATFETKRINYAITISGPDGKKIPVEFISMHEEP